MTTPDRLPLGEDVMVEQAAFYRAEAVDYDRWLTTLLDEHNEDPTAAAYREARAAIAHKLAARAPLGRLLELAAGTGRLAELYLPLTSSAVLLDASETSIAIARRRLQHTTTPLTFVEDDVFTWDTAGRTFDTIMFFAWLHHVPHPRFDRFWQRLADLLEGDGEVLFDYPDAAASPRGVADIPDDPVQGRAFYAPRDGISFRDNAGKRWRVVHNLWHTHELEARLAAVGWTMTVLGPGLFDNIIWASARRWSPAR